MSARTTTAAAYPTISTFGALLPADVLPRVASGALDGMSTADYGLPDGFSLRQAAARAWELLLPTYRALLTRLSTLPPGDPATVPTRDRWVSILLRELGYDLTSISGITVDDDTFDIGYRYGHVPVQILGWNVDLDERAKTNVRGASRTAPHSLVQELLNRTDDHLWAILTNGRRLRLLRDNAMMGRPAYVEFDLEGMFGGEQFADFAVMFALVHATRFHSTLPADARIEQWRSTAISEGTRALDHLRLGVVNALKALGSGFLEHPDNAALRDILKNDHAAANDYYRWLLRLVYRLIFLFVAEDRNLLHADTATPAARRWYADYFSTARLRRLAERRRAGRHTDLWHSLTLVFDALGEDGRPELGLPAYGSLLFAPGSLGALQDTKLTNERLLDAIRYLSQLPDRATNTMRPVDYKNLGAEELGSVYEALLEYTPGVDEDGVTFTLGVQAGNARKTSGSYYTPTDLVDAVLDECLDPLLDEAMRGSNPQAAILALSVCDPACGSGHFLVAAARRLARRLAIARTGDPEPTVEAVREAMRDVVTHCIYGVDLNDLAAELAKISLWLESLTPGRPLAFLDGHIKVGNGLLGVTPSLIAKNIPDGAFDPLVGDDPKYAGSVRKTNKNERERIAPGQGALFSSGSHEVFVSTAKAGESFRAVEQMRADDITALRQQADAWRRAEADPDLQRARLVADAWCAAFVWPLDAKAADFVEPITHRTLSTLRENPELVPLKQRRDMLGALARKYRFFHWYLEFPQIFTVDDSTQTVHGGFSCMIGNPPWGNVKIQEREFFAAAYPEIAAQRNAADRRKMIDALASDDPAIHAGWLHALRQADAEDHLIRSSGIYPLTGHGDVNTYALFAERYWTLTAPEGACGVITPPGLLTDKPLARFPAAVLDANALVAWLNFDNGARMFSGVGEVQRFSVTVLRRGHGKSTRVTSVLQRASELQRDDCWYDLTADDVRAINPETRTLPGFSSATQARTIIALHRASDVLGQHWPTLQSGNCIHMSGSAHLFSAWEDLTDDTYPGRDTLVDPTKAFPGYTPLWESKMHQIFDYRFKTYAGIPADKRFSRNPSTNAVTDTERQGPTWLPLPRYWLALADARAAWPSSRPWAIGLRRITNVDTNQRTLVASALPAAFGYGDSLRLIHDDTATTQDLLLLLANLNSLALDYTLRGKMTGSNLSDYILKQLPVLSRDRYASPAPWDTAHTVAAWMLPRIAELVITSRHLAAIGDDIALPKVYRWDPTRRALLRAELDAAFAHLYGLDRDELTHVLSTFGILRRLETKALGEYRTERLVLTAHDRLAVATQTGRPVVSDLAPEPGAGPHHT